MINYFFKIDPKIVKRNSIICKHFKKNNKIKMQAKYLLIKTKFVINIKLPSKIEQYLEDTFRKRQNLLYNIVLSYSVYVTRGL
ncbi:hypothetical protein BpHYR1_035934 [Brachionus plicatilis]|uniref:Uncharacterized protein n=1 Tax=Brachionus plicatilis TaxID=10195 RepID=A0A3M7QRB5_BRAPC|nr:hypothetical protein BpHYR1_035934 [Brachionus plicatilis]